MNNKMHADEIAINGMLVQKLIETQFSHWSHLPIIPINSSGTDNAIYRLGQELAIRLPRTASAALQIDKEYQWLPQFAPHLPLAIPVPLGKGLSTEDFPWPWLIYRWLEGKDATVVHITDLEQAAIDLGHFVLALQKINPAGGPFSRRGKPLATCDHETRRALQSLHGLIDVDAATRAWENALNVPVWHGLPVWTHGDLHAGNLLVDGDKLTAVIDFGMAGIGDPACDMMVAWTFLSANTRDIFRKVVNPDDATWARGRGWALTFGLVALPYYQHTNPVLAGIARRAIEAVLADENI